jgi:hypothetical protein
MPNYISEQHFLSILKEEMDKMIKAEGLILEDKFYQAMDIRLTKEVTRALARKSGIALPV